MNARTKRRSFLKRVNEEFLQKLTAEEHRRFTDNIGGVIQVIEYLESNTFQDGYVFICDAFDWARTPEGTDYWSNLAVRLKPVTVEYTENTDAELAKLRQQINDISEENQKLKVDLQQANLKLDSQSKPYVSDWDAIYQKIKTSRELKGHQVISLIDGILWLSHKFYPPVSIRGDEDN